MKARQDIAKRFWSKVDIRGPKECWPWKASLSRNGYGKFGVGGHNGGWREAHAVAYELTHGALLPGFLVMHSCDNRPCCNPRHLIGGTVLANIEDKIKKGRARWRTHLGAENGNAALADVDVIAMRGLYHFGSSRAELAREFGISWTQAHRIVTNKGWAVLAGRING